MSLLSRSIGGYSIRTDPGAFDEEVNTSPQFVLRTGAMSLVLYSVLGITGHSLPHFRRRSYRHPRDPRDEPIHQSRVSSLYKVFST